MALPARPPRTASYTFFGSAPAFWASTRASETAAILMKHMIWLHSFVTDPAPFGPVTTADDPMASKTSRTFPATRSSPPIIKASVPAMAPGSPPLTGASRKGQPASCARAANCFDSAGATELESMRTVPGVMPASTPSGPVRTSFTMRPFGSIVMTTS